MKNLIVTRIGIAFALVMAAFSAFAQDGGGATTFDPSSAVSGYQSGFTGILNTLAPLIVGIILVPAGYKIAMKWIRRGTNV